MCAFLAPNIVNAAVEGRLPRGFGLKRLVDLPADGLAGSAAQGRTPGASAGVTNDPLLTRLSSGDELIHPIRTGSSVEVRTRTYTVSQTATLETEICGQRLSTARAAMSHGDGRKEPADPLLLP
jgi:hypothetical protein